MSWQTFSSILLNNNLKRKSQRFQMGFSNTCKFMYTNKESKYDEIGPEGCRYLASAPRKNLKKL